MQIRVQQRQLRKDPSQRYLHDGLPAHVKKSFGHACRCAREARANHWICGSTGSLQAAPLLSLLANGVQVDALRVEKLPSFEPLDKKNWKKYDDVMA